MRRPSEPHTNGGSPLLSPAPVTDEQQGGGGIRVHVLIRALKDGTCLSLSPPCGVWGTERVSKLPKTTEPACEVPDWSDSSHPFPPNTWNYSRGGRTPLKPPSGVALNCEGHWKPLLSAFSGGYKIAGQATPGTPVHAGSRTVRPGGRLRDLG